MGIQTLLPTSKKERKARLRILADLRKQGMQVGGLAQTFWTLAVGLELYNSELSNIFNECLDQGLSKSGHWSGSGPGGNSIRTRLHLIFQVHSYHSDLRAAYVAHTHTHTYTHTHTHTHTHTRAHEPVFTDSFVRQST